MSQLGSKGFALVIYRALIKQPEVNGYRQHTRIDMPNSRAPRKTQVDKRT